MFKSHIFSFIDKNNAFHRSSSPSYAYIYIDKNEIQAVVAMANDPATSKAAQLFRHGCTLSPEEIRRGKVIILFLF
jgi:hypothetical protein